MSMCFLKRFRWLCFVFPALLLVGCENAKMESSRDLDSTSRSSDLGDRIVSNASVPEASIPEAEPSSYEFQPAVLITAAGEKVSVEEPGYACPTLFDMDKDGSEDLIVGQFASGKMKWYRNLSSPGEIPKYAEGEWVSSGDEPAEVPGVS